MLDTEKQQALVKVLKEKVNKQLLYYLDMCARCAICRDACHQYKTTRDIKYIPARKRNLKLFS